MGARRHHEVPVAVLVVLAVVLIPAYVLGMWALIGGAW